MLKQEISLLTGKKKPKIIHSVQFFLRSVDQSLQIRQIIRTGNLRQSFLSSWPVTKAIDERDGSVVAVKEVLQDKRYKNRELDIISRLDNDNIIFMKDYYFINRGEVIED